MRLCVVDDHRVAVRTADGGLADITHLVEPSVAATERMSALIADWDRLADAVRARASEPADASLATATVRAPQPSRAAQVIAAPANYLDHQKEMGGPNGVYKDQTIKTIETYAGFVKASSSIVGPDGAIELPFGDRRIDHEAEVGIVIGRRARHVATADALGYVFGYVPILDITVRGEEDRSYRKSFDTFTPLGPEIVTADEAGDPEDLAFALTVNGEPRQRASTRDLIYSVARLVELYSGAMTLEPGDVIASGTPAGVGPLVPGDVVELTVDGVGTLRMPVVAAAS